MPAMRTPSLYSQDDPITAALQPSPTETEHERRVRLQAEADAKRVSEQIDDDLREERERMKRRKGDVKVRATLFLSSIGSIYLHALRPAPASLTRTSGEWEIDTAKAVPADVQAKLARPRAGVLDYRHLLQCSAFAEAHLGDFGNLGRLAGGGGIPQ